MARRRSENIGFNPDDEGKKSELVSEPDETSGKIGNSPKVDPETLAEDKSGTSGGILPKFGSSNTDDTVSDTPYTEQQFPDDAYFKNPPLKNHLASVNIGDRTGNYLISVGLPFSGKTVLQSFTTYSMRVAGNLSVKPDIREEDGEINYQAQQLMTLWLDEWKKGRFPKGTNIEENEIREIRLNIENLENKSQNFNFSFLEISGENFKDVVPTTTSAPMLYDTINAFLKNDKIQLNIAFVLKTDEDQGEATNDALFTNFIDFIEVKLNLDLTQKVGLILVIPNPKKVFGENDWRRMRSNQSTDIKFYKKRVKSYIHDYFPATYITFDRWNSAKRAITVFHIGDEIEGHIENEDFRDARSFINLNYNFFTGKNLEPKNRFWKRILRLR